MTGRRRRRRIERAISLNPNHANAHSNLGVLQRPSGIRTKAEASYRAAIAIAPEHIDALPQSGDAADETGRTHEAVACLLPGHHARARPIPRPAACWPGASARWGSRRRPCDLRESGSRRTPRIRWPVTCWRRARAGRTGPGVGCYVVKVFDDFAGSFEAKLTRLCRTRAPAWCGALLADSGLPRRQAARRFSTPAAAPGCAVRCSRAVGAAARRRRPLGGDAGARPREKRVYDELTSRASSIAYLREHAGAYDAIVSADTLVYFGALEDVVTAAAAALRPAGRLVFTVEEAAPGRGGGVPARIARPIQRTPAPYVEADARGGRLGAARSSAELRMRSARRWRTSPCARPADAGDEHG